MVARTGIFRLCLDAACLPSFNPGVLRVADAGARAAGDAVFATAAGRAARRAAPSTLTVLARFPVLACAPSTAGKRMSKTSDPKVEHTSTVAASNTGMGFICFSAVSDNQNTNTKATEIKNGSKSELLRLKRIASGDITRFQAGHEPTCALC